MQWEKGITQKMSFAGRLKKYPVNHSSLIFDYLSRISSNPRISQKDTDWNC